MASTVILVDPVPGKAGFFKFPEAIAFDPDEPMDALENVGPTQKTRGTLRLKGKEHPIDVYVQKDAGLVFPYVLISDLEGLLV